MKLKLEEGITHAFYVPVGAYTVYTLYILHILYIRRSNTLNSYRFVHSNMYHKIAKQFFSLKILELTCKYNHRNELYQHNILF